MTLNQLKESLYFQLNSIGETVKDFPWEDPQYYSMFLRQTYSFVLHSTRLLCLSAAHLKNDEIHNRFIDHSMEEMAHEKLLEKDFKNLGVDADQLPELLPTMGIYQTQYYWIQHVNPISLFGYILLLEGLAVEFGPDVYSKIKEAHTDKSCNFLRIHVAADEDHLPKAFKTLEKCSSEELEIIEKALNMTSRFYHDSMKEVMKGEWNSKAQSAA